MTADLVTTCFKHPSPFGCSHDPPYGLTKAQVVGLATRGHAKCIHCDEDGDARKQIREFPTFGFPEQLFGLDVWHGRKQIPASSEHRVVLNGHKTVIFK